MKPKLVQKLSSPTLQPSEGGVLAGESDSMINTSSRSSLVSGASSGELADTDSLLSGTSSHLHTPDESRQFAEKPSEHLSLSQQVLHSNVSASEEPWLQDMASPSDSFPLKIETEEVPRRRTKSAIDNNTGHVLTPALMEQYGDDLTHQEVWPGVFLLSAFRQEICQKICLVLFWEEVLQLLGFFHDCYKESRSWAPAILLK